ncbi:hypothetical protein EDB80DRAFT_674997 [Ilyonectria destructans]|nr:hypothetical protein EDB80DRAFT_674997 [Ilyonectria destructans]
MSHKHSAQGASGSERKTREKMNGKEKKRERGAVQGAGRRSQGYRVQSAPHGWNGILPSKASMGAREGKGFHCPHWAAERRGTETGHRPGHRDWAGTVTGQSQGPPRLTLHSAAPSWLRTGLQAAEPAWDLHEAREERGKMWHHDLSTIHGSGPMDCVRSVLLHTPYSVLTPHSVLCRLLAVVRPAVPSGPLERCDSALHGAPLHCTNTYLHPVPADRAPESQTRGPRAATPDAASDGELCVSPRATYSSYQQGTRVLGPSYWLHQPFRPGFENDSRCPRGRRGLSLVTWVGTVAIPDSRRRPEDFQATAWTRSNPSGSAPSCFHPIHRPPSPAPIGRYCSQTLIQPQPPTPAQGVDALMPRAACPMPRALRVLSPSTGDDHHRRRRTKMVTAMATWRLGDLDAGGFCSLTSVTPSHRGRRGSTDCSWGMGHARPLQHPIPFPSLSRPIQTRNPFPHSPRSLALPLRLLHTPTHAARPRPLASSYSPLPSSRAPSPSSSPAIHPLGATGLPPTNLTGLSASSP